MAVMVAMTWYSLVPAMQNLTRVAISSLSRHKDGRCQGTGDVKTYRSEPCWWHSEIAVTLEPADSVACTAVGFALAPSAARAISTSSPSGEMQYISLP